MYFLIRNLSQPPRSTIYKMCRFHADKITRNHPFFYLQPSWQLIFFFFSLPVRKISISDLLLARLTSLPINITHISFSSFHRYIHSTHLNIVSPPFCYREAEISNSSVHERITFFSQYRSNKLNCSNLPSTSPGQCSQFDSSHVSLSPTSKPCLLLAFTRVRVHAYNILDRYP